MNTGKMVEKGGEEWVTNALGTGTPSDPVIGFIDHAHTIITEQWSIEGRWRGWYEEYFRRKLKGK
jgi:hypothetical protein